MVKLEINMVSPSTKLLFATCVVNIVTLWTMKKQVVADGFPDVKMEDCPRRGTCTPSLASEIGTVYCEVVGGFCLMIALLLVVRGNIALQGCCAVMFSLFTKHFLVNGLVA